MSFGKNSTEGCEVYFKPKEKKYLGVAGLYNVWKTQGSERFYSMTFLMRPASKYVMERGHHRQPFFIREDGFDAWMEIMTTCDLTAFASNRIVHARQAIAKLDEVAGSTVFTA